jgi:site-specific recombinase XerD
MKPTDFAVQLSRYLGAYLPGQLGSSVNTVRSYRDTFSLFLRYCSNEHGLPPQTLTLDKITHTLIEQFLLWLENEKMCCAATRNNRLAAIHAFYRYLQLEMPQLLKRCQDILAVPYKKNQKKVMPYLTLDGIKAILAQPNIATVSGRRDLAMLSLLYDTGARVQELVDLRMMDVRLSSLTVIRLTGKGNKARLVPIMAATEKLLRQYLDEHDKDHSAHGGYPLFCNRSGKKLTRAGVAYILNKYLLQAKMSDIGSMPESLSPHGLRHSKAMHLLQSGVNLVYIRDLLGHADISTTEVYARADEHSKRKALEMAYPSPTPVSDTTPAWHKNDDLMDWLKNIGK